MQFLLLFDIAENQTTCEANPILLTTRRLTASLAAASLTWSNDLNRDRDFVTGIRAFSAT